jgi:putative restriction endonuclease
MSDSRTSSSVNVAEIAEQRVVLRDVSWSTYESLLDDLADTSSPRLAYDEGTLEIMTPLGRHEALNRTLAMLVGALAEELGIDIQDYGSTTFRRKPHRKGFEPDSCFYVQHESAVRGKERLDLESDPPPDVAVEIELRGARSPGSLAVRCRTRAYVRPRCWPVPGATGGPCVPAIDSRVAQRLVVPRRWHAAHVVAPRLPQLDPRWNAAFGLRWRIRRQRLTQ